MAPPAAPTPAWPGLHARIDAARDAWRDATQGLIGDERAGADDWSAAQIHSHVAAALLRDADALSHVALGRPAVLDNSQRLLPGRHPYPRIRDLGEKGWTDFRNAARTVAKGPERGPVIARGDDRLTAAALVQRGLSHIHEHLHQIRSLPPAPKRTEPPMSAWQFPNQRAADLHTWVVDRAARDGWPQVLQTARETQAGWQEAVTGLAEEDAPPLPRDGEEWSPWNVGNHVAGWLERAAAALQGALQGQSTHLSNEQAWLGDDRSFADVRRSADESWTTYLVVLEAAQTRADESAVITHRNLGPMSPREYAVFSTWHLTDHLKQLRTMQGRSA